MRSASVEWVDLLQPDERKRGRESLLVRAEKAEAATRLHELALQMWPSTAEAMTGPVIDRLIDGCQRCHTFRHSRSPLV